MADAGTAGSVVAAPAGTQKAGGMAGLLGARTAKAQGPNAAAYNDERERAHQSSDAYNGLAQNYTQTGPTIANQYQGESRAGIASNLNDQRGLANSLMQNNGQASRAQFQGGLDRSIASQMAMANSAPGGAVAQAGAMRNAQAQGAMMQAQGASEAARLGALERQAALGQAAGVYNNMGGQLQAQYGLEQTSAVHQGQLDSQNQAQQNEMRQGYGRLGGQAQAQGLNALNGYTDANLRAQGASAGLQQASGNAWSQAVGVGSNVLGTAASALGGGGKPKAAQGGAIGPASNSIAAIYNTHVPAEAPAPRNASLAEALAGLDALRAELTGRARADGGALRTQEDFLRSYGDDPSRAFGSVSPVETSPESSRAQWERSFGSADQAREDVKASDNRHEAAKIRAGFERDAARDTQPSTFARVMQGIGGGLRSFDARADGGYMGEQDGMRQLSGPGMSSSDVLLASTGRTGNAMVPVGGGGVVGGGNVPGGAGGGGGGGRGLGGVLSKLGGMF